MATSRTVAAWPAFARAALPLTALLTTALSPAPVVGQSAGIYPQATQLPASTRAMALGGAYQNDSAHADAIFYHPALLAGAGGFGLELQRWGGEASLTAASAALPWLGGGVGIGLQSLQYGGPSGATAPPGGQDHLFRHRSLPVSERVATVGYAREVPFDVDAGVSLKLVDARVGTVRQNVALVDLGVAKDLGSVVVSFSALDIGEKPIIDSGDGPTRFLLGAGGYGRPLGPLDVGFAANVGVADGEAIYGGGIEVGYWPIQGRTFLARLGFQDVPEGSDAKPFTAGLAFWGDDVTVEWAFRPFGGDADEGGSHRFGLRWR